MTQSMIMAAQSFLVVISSGAANQKLGLGLVIVEVAKEPFFCRLALRRPSSALRD